MSDRQFSKTGPSNSPIQPLSVDDGGNGGLPVVFLHSLAGHSGHWSASLDHLRPHRRALAFDWRGHGRSGPAKPAPAPSEEDFSVPTLVADVAAAIDRLGLEQFVLVGHSAGGLIALAYAARHPERVAGLLLVDPSGDARQQVPPEQAEAFLAALDSAAYAETIEGYWRSILTGSDPGVTERVLTDLRTTSPGTVRGVLRTLLAYDPTAEAGQYQGPARLVVTPLNTGPGSLIQLRPDWPAEIVEETGHWLHLDRPDQFQKVLDEFLASLT